MLGEELKNEFNRVIDHLNFNSVLRIMRVEASNLVTQTIRRK